MRTLILAFVLTVLGFVAHEAAHGLAGNLLGYTMQVTINHASAVGGFEERSHGMIVALAGPVATLLLAVLAASLARGTGSIMAWLLAYTSLLQRMTAQAISLMSPNDEMRVSMDLGIGTWTLPAAIVILLLLATLWGARGAKPTIGQWLLGFVGANLGITAVVFGEPYLPTLQF